MKLILRLLTALALIVATTSLRADEVTENLDSAKTAYEAGNYSEAITAVDYVNQLIRQKKGEEIKKFLPDAPKGWEADEATSESATTSMLGGGISVSRTYHRENGNVTIKIQSDSAVMQFAILAVTAGGGTKESIKGQKITVNFTSPDDSSDIKTVVDNRYYIEINGSKLTRDELVSFAKAIPFAKLTAMK